MSYRFQDNLSPPFFHCSQVTILMHYSPLVLTSLWSHLILSTTRLPYVWSPHGWSVGLSYFVPNLRSYHLISWFDYCVCLGYHFSTNIYLVVVKFNNVSNHSLADWNLTSLKHELDLLLAASFVGRASAKKLSTDNLMLNPMEHK